LKIAIGSDHRGYSLKEKLKEMLTEGGHVIVDVGTGSADSVDYPDFAIPVAEKTASGEVDRGIVVCGSGIGVSIVANKVAGARAALCYTVEEALMTRKHNDSNVLALAERMADNPDLEELVRVWLETEFEGGRHKRRIDKISDYENNQGA
jgi:ribose 5-phosphate isomerase B